MNDNVTAAVIIGIVVAVIGGGIYVGILFYSPYQVTIKVIDTIVVPASKDKGSYYIVYGMDGDKKRNIEIEWIGWLGPNRDNLLHDVKTHLNSTMTFKCAGFENQGIEWYPLCSELVTKK